MKDAKWKAEFAHSQAVTHLVINGQSYERLRFYADETDDEIEETCGHCEVSDTSFHLLGCEAERCPRCRRQIISCGCSFAPVPGEPPFQWRTRRA